MARIRITLEDDDGREINGDQERLYDVSGGATRLVDIEAAVENFKQAASSCKFIGDDLQLCGNLLGEPQLFPLLVKFHHF